MPHKHRRDKASNDSVSDLPPKVLAKPLPVQESIRTIPKNISASQKGHRRKVRRSGANGGVSNDDTPRAFARLMAYQTGKFKPPSGLDDGSKRGTKQNRSVIPSDGDNTVSNPEAPGVPSIKPGEKLSDFSARVDAALPVAGLIGKGRKTKGLGRQTKLEKKMQKMQNEWREVDTRRKEKLAEEQEELEDQWFSFGVSNDFLPQSHSKRRKLSTDKDLVTSGRPTSKSRSSNLVGLHDVVQAPPHFSKSLKEKLSSKAGIKAEVPNVPRAKASLKRREDLGEVRQAVVNEYRRLMEKRNP